MSLHDRSRQAMPRGAPDSDQAMATPIYRLQIVRRKVQHPVDAGR